jgi:glutamine synthetase
VTRESFLESIGDGAVRRVVLLVPDPHARFAAVELAADFVRDEVLDRGYGACTYLFAWDVHRQPVDVPELARYLGGYGDLVLRPDLDAVHPLEPGRVAVVCDAEWPDGSPVELAPRQLLRGQLAAAAALGLAPSAGLEHEVTVTTPDGVPVTAAGADYAFGGTEPLAPLLAELRTATAPLGVESARAECHPGQYEIVLRHRPPLAACDAALLLRHRIRTTAAGLGLRAHYLAAQAPGQGSSGHVHLSLNPADPRPGTGVLPEPLGAFLAGVLAAARPLTAIGAPTTNSYVRLRTAPFAPRELRWGVDDRTAAVRLAGRGPGTRLEFRFAGADATPHLVLAALLAAGLDGVRRGLTPPPPGAVVGELAATPWAARDELRGPEPARLLGPAVVAQQLALLDTELDALCDTVSDTQRARAALRA